MNRGGVVAVVEANDHVRVSETNQSLDGFFELTGWNLARTPATGCVLGQTNLRIISSHTYMVALLFGGVRVLVATPVFKTGEVEHLGLAGSIPVRLRQNVVLL